MAYKLYTDKSEVFECDVAVKNATLKNSFARLIIESDDVDLVFKGKIQDGKCTVPIRKLKGLLDESVKGNMHLEIIVEDTYFKPWESDFVVEEHTSIKVQVKEQKTNSDKPILEVKIKQPSVSKPAKELSFICERFDVTSKNYNNSRKNEFKQIVKGYFEVYTNLKPNLTSILKETVSVLK